MVLSDSRAAALRLLQRFTTVPPSRALQLLHADGCQLSQGVVQQVTDEQVEALLAAGRLLPPGPHVEVAWREIESGLPWPKPAPKEPVSPPAGETTESES